MSSESTVQLKACARCRIEKPLSSFYKDRRAKSGVTSSCAECQKAWREKNKEAICQRLVHSRAKNKESIARWNREWQKKNPEKVAAKKQRYHERHRDRLNAEKREKRTANIENERERGRRWAKENPQKAAAINARRRARILQATPAWADEFIIGEIYDLAKARTQATGIKFTVDHVIPLRSRLVCGLHVEHNLAVITAAKNFSKQNRYWPEMP